MALPVLLFFFSSLFLSEAEVDRRVYQATYSRVQSTGERVTLFVGVPKGTPLSGTQAVSISSWANLDVMGPDGTYLLFKDPKSGEVFIQQVTVTNSPPLKMPPRCPT